MKAIIFGAPGAGKGTYASRLKAKLDIEVISMGDIFRELAKQDTELSRKVKSSMEKGSLVPDEIVTEVLKQHIAKIPSEKGILFDGYPRTLEQAKALDSIVKINVIILLDVPDWIIIERLSSRRICKKCGAVYNTRFLKPKVEGVCDKCGGSLYLRSDDNPEVIKNRLQVYQNQTSPLLQFYRDKKVPFVLSKTTALEAPPDALADEIIENLKKLKFA